MRALVSVALLALGSCSPDEGPLMAPGQDCLACHHGGEARRWTVAGTWTRGARVTVTDAGGRSVTLRGNKVGNFYTAEPLTPPFSVSVDGATMPADALKTGPLRYGGCNLCHAGAAVMALGIDMAPNRDCLGCHDGFIAPRFHAAGTFPGATTVELTDRNGVVAAIVRSAASGNFYTETPLTPPLVARVDGSRMDPDPAYGGCNACHQNGEADD
jgi:hypothetical protein